MSEINEEKRVGIPESITINGVVYAVKDTPELQQFIQEVAKVEKSKLYTQFENLKAQISNLSKVKVVDEGLDVSAIVSKMKELFVTKEDFKEMLPAVLKEVVQPVLSATEQNRLDELSQYRESLIRDNLGTCIPELVVGNSKDELQASLLKSIKLRSSYPSPSTAGIDTTKHVTDPLITKQQNEFNQNFGTGSPTQQQNFNGTQTPPPITRRPQPDVAESPKVKHMSMEEFAKQRENLQAQLEATYGGGGL